MKGIEIVEISKCFGHKTVLDRCSLTIKPQQSLVLIGQSGSGKSVMSKCALGLMAVDRGQIRVDGVDLCQETALQQEERFSASGVVFQSYALFDSLSVWENVAFGLSGDKDDRRRRALAMLARVELAPETADLFPSDISGGMKRRVSIARAIIKRPQYLFFDEPTEGLDPVLSITISQLIRQVISDLGATALTITHNMHNAAVIADEVAVLDEGKIAWQGPVHTMASSKSDLLHAFLKAQAMIK
jgi:phospholipid/cholesterol/gamma-HCH transport system ATP-binding protein